MSDFPWRFLPSKAPSESKITRRLVLVAVIAVIAVLSAYAALTAYHILSGSSSVTEPPPELSIFSGTEIVPPSQWLAKNFSYTASNTPVIVGSFVSTGSGLDNSIRIIVVTVANFSIFERTGLLSAYYNSGKVSSGTLNVSLPSGNGEYTFVLDNTFDSGQSKNLVVNVTLLV